MNRFFSIRLWLSAALMSLLLAGPASAAQLRTEHFTFHTTDRRLPVAQRLADEAEDVLEDIALQLGVSHLEQKPIMVRVLENEAALSRAMPHSSMTEWAAGIAFPKSSLILLKADHKTMFELHDVFRHEISHIVLSRAVNQARLPHWLIEGLAVLQAGEHVRDRWQKSGQAMLTDSLPALSTITNGFPADASRVDMAYAQSTAFVSWLVANNGWPNVRRLLRIVREGDTFTVAFERVYRKPVVRMEAQWRRDLESGATWTALLRDSSLMWVLAGLLFVFAWITVRARNAERLVLMDEPGLDDEFA
ncbi:MAG: hypothetical protein ACI9WU_005017 [Myxococcota bacterium]|jgi:hypothetical protein